ncbi:AAA family ATPase [Candidatus Halocynthiibacter alkanivorans]|jgi:pilus assembly protein CpaE|uniref:AAA family ATPase n=1 Tax=Candidatus Halocynthiibacter alkanivorans TaxID=2267619 RepID=UPI000DF1AA58|nr:AAA family ATPase [Candidatus Halocynthiibacter alkanivorans]
MTSSVALHPEPAPIVACTVSRDVQNFGLLIEDMEAALGESWGDLSFEDARVFLDQPEAATLEFIAVALDDGDEDQLAEISALIDAAKAQDVRVILIAEDVSPIVLHQLLKQGAEEFVPYPLPDGALHDAIDRLRAPETPQARELPAELQSKAKATNDCNGVVLPVQGMAGGTGATTLAVNLAWELANSDKKNPPRVCILDFDLQFGSVATFLDLPRRESIFELLSDTESMDSDSFMQSLLNYNERLHVFTAPSEILPLDIVTSEDISRILEAARVNFDYVIIDMPSTIVQWTETVLSAASVYFVTLELDMRSAQNTLRMIRALKAEDLPTEKLRFVLNRAPRRTDLQGKSRAKRLAESLDIDIELQLPDGGKQVSQSADHGLPLSQSSAKNPLRKEISKLAVSVHQHNQVAANG